MKVKSESEVVQSCPTPSDPMDCSISRLLHPWDFPGKSTGVGCHCLLQKDSVNKYIVGNKMQVSILLLEKGFTNNDRGKARKSPVLLDWN